MNFEDLILSLGKVRVRYSFLILNLINILAIPALLKDVFKLLRTLAIHNFADIKS